MIGPMFRYDRPQAGRYREFWQFDVEAIGDPGPAVDAEIIELASRFYRDAGLPDVVIQLNSIGDPACRPAYIEELTAYYRAHAGELPALERARLERNPLRILDSKDDAVAALNAAAPMPTDRLCDACADALRGGSRAPRCAGRRVRARAAPRPRARLLHADGVRGLPAGRERPAVGDRGRGTVRRAGRAAGRAPDAGHRLRDRARPRAARARGGGRGRRREGAARPSRSSSGATPRIRSRACASPRTCAPPGSRCGPNSGRASSASSSRPPRATGRTSRSSSATSWAAATSSCGTSRPAHSAPCPSQVSLVSSNVPPSPTATASRQPKTAANRVPLDLMAAPGLRHSHDLGRVWRPR